MKVAIDNVGRMVIPKVLREELGITGAAEVEMRAVDGHIEMTVPDVSARIEMRGGLPVIVTDEPMEPMTVETVRAAIDRVRR